MFSDLIDFIFPRTSIISGERLGDSNLNQYFKVSELNLISKVTSEDLTDLRNKVISDHSFAMFAFRDGDEFSRIIYELKYGGMKRLGIYLGNLFGDELKCFLETQNIPDFDYIIPVPLFKTKVRERGYNQSEFLCKGIAEKIKIKFIPDLTKRIRHTSTQTKLSREERILNMKDAFVLNKKYENEISGKRIILVDDVVTTGSTMNEVIKVLKMHNCGEAMACSLAMAR